MIFLYHVQIAYLFIRRGRRVFGISGSLIWSKTLKELIFNFYDEFWWCPEGPVSQIHSLHIHVGAPWIFSELSKSLQMLKREWVRKAAGSYRTYSIPGKAAAWYLSLRWKTCLRQNSGLGFFACREIPALGKNIDMMMMIMMISKTED